MHKFSEHVCHSKCARCIDDQDGFLIIGETYTVFDVDGPYIDIYGKGADGNEITLCGLHEDGFEFIEI